MRLPQPLHKLFPLLVFLILLLTLGFLLPYYNETSKLIKNSDYALLETPLINPITGTNSYVLNSCTSRFKLALPKNFSIEKMSGIDSNESCIFKEATINFLHQKTIIIFDHSDIWKSKVDILKENMESYKGRILQKEVLEVKTHFSHERNYFLKDKLLHDFFVTHNVLIYFSRPLIILKSLTGFDLNSKEVYFQKANDNYLVRTSGERKLPHQESFEIFLKNNLVLNVRFHHFEKKEIDTLVTKWTGNGVETTQPQR